MKKYADVFAVSAFVFAALFTGCATTVSMRVLRAPAMNVAGIRRIVILPFETTDGSPRQQEAAAYLAGEAARCFREIDYYTVVDASMLAEYRRSGETIANHIDAQFRGRILSITAGDTSGQVKRKDRDGNEYYVTVYRRNVEMVFNYGFVRTRDGTTIGPVEKRGSAGDSNEDSSALRSVPELLRTIISGQMAGFNRDVAPYTVIERRALENGRSKDKTLKQIMKDISRMVAAGNYQAALEAYQRIYNEYRNFAAAYNAAIMQEALGDLDAALASMRVLAAGEPGNPKPSREALRLQARIAEQDRAQGLLNQPRRRTDALAALMVATLQAHIPQNAKVAVLNTSRTERTLTDTCAASIISGLAQRGVTIVDRNSTGLLEAERNYQASGAVSDSDFVSLGNAAGVSAFVLVSISGAGDMRRLQIRVVDVETGRVLYQSPQDDSMNI